jgi:hypothetical protein
MAVVERLNFRNPKDNSCDYLLGVQAAEVAIAFLLGHKTRYPCVGIPPGNCRDCEIFFPLPKVPAPDNTRH